MSASREDRFWSHVSHGKDDECWLWTGKLSGRGYGQLTFNGKNTVAHRVSMLLFGKEIPEGFVVDHTCRNRLCVNPHHLRAVDKRTNSIENSIGPTAINAAKTHCPKGHEYTPENTRISNGKRNCRACQKVWHAQYVLDRRAARLARAALTQPTGD